MLYHLKIRKIKPFELYNNLEVGDIAELGFFLQIGESPKKRTKPIVAEHLWVRIKERVLEANEIYSAELTEEPRFLKRLHKGDTVSFSPENVLNAKSKKPERKVKSLKDFAYSGNDKKRAEYKHVISNGTHCFAIDPQLVVLRSVKPLPEAKAISDLDPITRQEIERMAARFENVKLDKFHVKIDAAFIKKSIPKIRARSSTKSSVFTLPLIRISDRMYLSFNLVAKILVLLKKMLVYLEIHDESPQLYFISDAYDGFISLAEHSADSVVIDVLEI